MTYTPTIGIEVHAELKTATKMFCNSKNEPHAAAPNTHICPVCLAHPGTLPVINKKAVEHVLRVGVALGASIATYTEFDRKNYFYPDIPKGYQISQYEYPLVKGGELAGVAITRVHLEEDTARSAHDASGSIVDFNRAGVPLMELVTEPVIHDAKIAANFARELQLLLRTLGCSDANMEKGEMRVEANISVSATDTLGTKVEVKNLNSFKSVENAIEFEIRRQIRVLEQNGQITQETRGWDENKGKTFPQRLKEGSDDYRYFPDPDLPSLDLTKVSEFNISRIEETMPETPNKKRNRYVGMGIRDNLVEVLVGDVTLGAFFEKCLEYAASETREMIANYLTSDVRALLAEGKTLEGANPETFVALITMTKEGSINSRTAKNLLQEVLFDGSDPEQIAKDRGLLQSSNSDKLLPIVERVLAEHAGVVAEYKSGKEAALQFLIGQCMKETKGTANPGALAKLLTESMA
ncbi:Asp-tRNA(Asn)/Glu-tRNA(Gln) amidotransferase subunit GatB [Candidatus Kaiserbacteria bacterium]|nr:Asp-tRNA(Asn)/Glu-tRNA(Gln) amidotransferase subunit GatB [Candidatus Kaiserbacteria bacterium]